MMGRLDLNCSLVLAGLPRTEWAAAARNAGYTAIEMWWPFPTSDPARREVDALVGSIERAGLEVVLLNFPEGHELGLRGLGAVPGREADFRHAADAAVALGRRLGVGLYNPVLGDPVPGLTVDDHHRVATRNLAIAADLVGEAALAIEPLSRPGYIWKEAASVLSLIAAVRAAGAPNIGMLADLYHLAVNAEDVERLLRTRAHDIVHVQVADAPGRGIPGGGLLPLCRWLEILLRAGYSGRFGLEYVPEDGTFPGPGDLQRWL